MTAWTLVLRDRLLRWYEDVAEEPMISVAVLLALVWCSGVLHSRPATALRSHVQTLELQWNVARVKASALACNADSGAA